METAEARVMRLRRTSDGAARDALLTELLTVDAMPVVEGALNHRRAMINPDDREDLKAQVFVRLLRKLTSAADMPIESFDDYVATVTYHVVDDYVRATNPEGAMVANRIRYLLRHDDRFAAWDIDGEAICGLAGWAGQRANLPERLERFPSRQVDGSALLGFFRSLGSPLSLRTLIAHATSRPASALFSLAVEDRGFAGVETRQLLNRLWDEIAKLPLQQRIALLFSVRDSRSTSALAGTTSIDEVARTIGWENAALAEIWNELPFEDDRIGAMLGLTRQQVINLRKSARARLTRRMEQWS
jgi:hypothetical protein